MAKDNAQAVEEEENLEGTGGDFFGGLVIEELAVDDDIPDTDKGSPEAAKTEKTKEVDGTNATGTLEAPPEKEEEEDEETEDTKEEEEDKEEEDDDSEEDEEEDDSDDKEEDSDEDSKDSDSDDDNAKTGQYGRFMESLVENEVLSVVDEEKEYDDSPEGVRELIEDNIKQGVQNGLSTYKESLPEKARELLEFYDKYGEHADISQFIEEAAEVDFAEVDHTIAENQALLVEDYLISQGYEKEEIKATLEEYSAAGSLTRHAKRAKEKLAAMQQEERQAREEARETQMKKMEEQRLKQVEAFKNTVSTAETISGFPISKKERSQLIDYVTKPVDSQGNTQLQLDSQNSDDSELLYAFLKMKGLTYDKIMKGASSKSTLKLKKDLNRFTDKNVKRKSGKQQREESDDDGKLIIPDLW